MGRTIIVPIIMDKTTPTITTQIITIIIATTIKTITQITTRIIITTQTIITITGVIMAIPEVIMPREIQTIK
jgi:hypothetical protein